MHRGQNEVREGEGQLCRAQSTQKEATSPSGRDKEMVQKWDPQEEEESGRCQLLLPASEAGTRWLMGDMWDV